MLTGLANAIGASRRKVVDARRVPGRQLRAQDGALNVRHGPSLMDGRPSLLRTRVTSPISVFITRAWTEMISAVKTLATE